MSKFRKGDRVYLADGTPVRFLSYNADIAARCSVESMDGTRGYRRRIGELFFSPPEIPESAQMRPESPKPKHNFKWGDLVVVWNNTFPIEKFIRAFGTKEDDGFICWSSDENYDHWDNCVPYDRALLNFNASTKDLPEGTEIEVTGVGGWNRRKLLAVLSDGRAIVQSNNKSLNDGATADIIFPKFWRLLRE